MNTAPKPALAGKFFEDLRSGEVFESHFVLVTSEVIRGFADLTGDRNPLHIDEAEAASGPFGQIVAHGALIYSLALGLASQIDDLAQSKPVTREILNWTFIHTVAVRQNIRVRLSIAKLNPLRESTPFGKVLCNVQVLNDTGNVVADGQLLLLVSKHPTSPDFSNN